MIAPLSGTGAKSSVGENPPKLHLRKSVRGIIGHGKPKISRLHLLIEWSRQKSIYQRLLDYYGLPEWRDPLPPLDELISTILSQNTNDVNRDIAFNRLREKFSTWEEVRDAEQSEVIEAIRIAGLANQKGPRMQNVLRQITEERGDTGYQFPAGLVGSGGLRLAGALQGSGALKPPLLSCNFPLASLLSRWIPMYTA